MYHFFVSQSTLEGAFTCFISCSNFLSPTTLPQENFASNLKLKCVHSFYPDISRAIWQCLHTNSSHIFGFLFYPINAVLISVTSAPSNAKIWNVKKKIINCQWVWQQPNTSNSGYSFEYILLLSPLAKAGPLGSVK